MNVSRYRMAAGLVACVLMLSSLAAMAKKGRQIVRNDSGMEAHIFRAAVDTKGHFTVDTTPVLPHMAISLGLMLDFGFHDWIAVETDGKYDGYNNRQYKDTMINTYIDSRFPLRFPPAKSSAWIRSISKM